ncbi:MAG: hypothetical protein IPN36_00705 [Bacteroidetes bacterium]|nr:hypothetical protein [Bacteroidota bacterium]
MKKLLHIVRTIQKLPHAEIKIDTQAEEGKRMFSYYTKRHPRFFIIRNKTIGVALLPLLSFDSFENYLSSVSGKNSAAYYARKAEKNGYAFRKIDPDVYADAIHQIHTSSNTRQGKSLTGTYLKPLLIYPKNEVNTYFGLFKGEELVAYLWLVRSGELITFNRLMGHADYLKDGIMFMLVLKGVEQIFTLRDRPAYIMYDTLLAASDVLGLFNRRLGFKHYKVKWKA